MRLINAVVRLFGIDSSETDPTKCPRLIFSLLQDRDDGESSAGRGRGPGLRSYGRTAGSAQSRKRGASLGEHAILGIKETHAAEAEHPVPLNRPPRISATSHWVNESCADRGRAHS